jgi:lysine 2,3-aminomutase
VKGIVHRYPDRVLLKPLHVCPVYCRFCFRREKVGPGGEALSADELAAALAYIRGRPEIWEVILTGGDPLMLAPRRLAELMAALDAIPHVAIVRLHSRVPIVDPERVTGELVRALKPGRVAVWLAVHCNHARELAEGQALMKALRGRLSGLAQPTYVLDVPGGHGKVPVGPSYLADDPGALRVEDAFGGQHRYPSD